MKEKHNFCVVWVMVLLSGFAIQAYGQVVLLDGETDADMSAWSGMKRVSVGQAAYLPVRGAGSMQLDVPVLQGPEGHRQEVRRENVPVTDWRPYDRLTLDVFNDGPVSTLMRIEVKTGSNEAQRHFSLPAGRWVRIMLPTTQLDPELADISQVKEVQIAVHKQSQPLVVYLDNMLLLKPDETMPSPEASFISEAVRRLKAEVDAVGQAHTKRCAAFKSRRAARIAEWSGASALKSLRDIGRLLNASDTSAEVLAALGERIDRAGLTLARIPSIVDLEQACQQAGTQHDKEVLIGMASSMVKLMPRHMPLELEPAPMIPLSAARGETESVQIAVLPLRRALSRVTLRVEDMRSDDGQVLPQSQIDCDVMGYIETKEQPPGIISYVGWWPDPILDFLGPVDIAAGDLQSFWLRVRVPRDQAPGLYRGQAVLEGRSMKGVRIPLTVQVYSFTMPPFSPLPTAITFGPPCRPWSVILYDLVNSPQWNGGLKYQWADFLADYYITYDHLYRSELPDFEILEHLQKQGRLGAFNLGNFDVPLLKDGGSVDPNGLRRMLEWAGTAYRAAGERGLLNHAYTYGYDEVKEEQYAAVEETASAIKKAMPDILTMTTARDYTYGRDTAMQSIDVWVPPTNDYDAPMAADARVRGRQVWWYIAIVPRTPYANIFIEYSAIETRLLMGAMAAKYRPDGFLYYQTSLWKSKEPIKTGPFTDWDPRSYRDAHGDGSWLCMRHGGLPVPTIRLENYRDGLEDYACVRILEEAIRLKEGRGDSLTEADRRWLAEAMVAIEVPSSLVASLTEFSRNPQELSAWRNKVAGLIEASGQQNIDPWRGKFGLRRNKK